MANYNLTFGGCGHDGSISLVGNSKTRESRLDYLERHGVCSICYAASKKAEQKKAELALIEKASKISPSLADLVGSEKQIAWAIKIRATMLADAADNIKSPSDKYPEAINSYLVALKSDVLAALSSQVSAKWFIDNRDESRIVDLICPNAQAEYKAILAEVNKPAIDAKIAEIEAEIAALVPQIEVAQAQLNQRKAETDAEWLALDAEVKTWSDEAMEADNWSDHMLKTVGRKHQIEEYQSSHDLQTLLREKSALETTLTKIKNA